MKKILACVVGLLAAVSAAPAGAMNWAVKETAVECLALAVYWEARSQSPDEQSAVAHVAINRAGHPDFPDSVCAVVKQGGVAKRGRCQFSWWCDGRADIPREPDAWQAALDRAEAALEGMSDDPTGGAVYFHNKTVRPKWSIVKERTTEIGKHIFYR